MRFNEDTRVKIPTILHLIRLGYSYLSLKNTSHDETTNIFVDLFNESLKRINPDITDQELTRTYDDISLCLDNEDLGKAFYEKLIDKSGIRLIDFENFNNNSFHVVTELTYKKDDEEFRPDIILLINGIPLAFIEVKKPNNRDGIIAEHKRILTRFKNKKFRRFVNITQFMVFSNNMKYDDTTPIPVEGAFYASPSYDKSKFNYFREEEAFDMDSLLSDNSEELELKVLIDTNTVGIKNSPEFITNKSPETPTNRLCTSLFQRERLAFILEYAFAYVKDTKRGWEKHIMRYPQLFATKAIERKLAQGIKKGIIWHTQGSGKTALAYFNVKYLTDYFRKKGVIPKFYFIVDRIDLLTQAAGEFRARGLKVYEISSRYSSARDIKSDSVIHNNFGMPEITVVNIQKFQDDPDVIPNKDYKIDIQRVFFLDEVHRSYNPKGSFLANLEQADRNAIKIGLTGTPLILTEDQLLKSFENKGNRFNSKAIFGDYIHKYYYNLSIKDGYTLRLIREEIDTSYKLTMQRALEEIQILKGNSDKKMIYAHHRFAEPMLDYIVDDFEKARNTMEDPTIGGMVICDSSDQAKKLYEIFQEKYADKEFVSYQSAAEGKPGFGDKLKKKCKVKSAALILHDIGTKQDRKDLVDDYNDGKIDLLFVFNMLLTGFNAPRLKKLYMGRVIKAHNLLQALTRVNRTYNNYKYGYVVDFADIQSEFDKTNRNYFNELQSELGDEIEHYSNLFKSVEEIEEEIQGIKEVLFYYDTQNAENFSTQISQINDRGEMLTLIRSLDNAKNLYNLIRLSGNYELLNNLNFEKLNILSRDAHNRLLLINTKLSLENKVDTTNLLNMALEDVIFAFTKVKEEELILADQLKNTLQKTREALGSNFDQNDPEFISLKEELERLFKKKNLTEVTREEMDSNIGDLEKIYSKARELERKNQLLRAKYQNDEKYARLHKRLMERDPLTDSESKLFEALSGLKKEVDEQILQNAGILENESFVSRMMMKLVIDQFKNKQQIPLDLAASKRINAMVVKEYMNEYNGQVA